jgi:hypothetical protein
MNRPIIAMTASIDMSIITPNKLSCGLAVGAIFRRTKILTPVETTFERGGYIRYFVGSEGSL